MPLRHRQGHFTASFGLVCQIIEVTSLLGESLSPMLGISGWTLQLGFQGLHCDV